MEYRERSSRWTENRGHHSPSTSGHAESSRIQSGSPARSHTQQESRDVVRERSISRERDKRPQFRSSEVNYSHRVGAEDHRRCGIDRMHQDTDNKGKGRAVDLDGDTNISSRIEHRPNSAYDSPKTLDATDQQSEYEEDRRESTITEQLNDVTSAKHDQESSHRKQKGRPKVRREALQAMNAHLLNSSHGHRSSKPVIGREQQPPDTPRDELPPPTELSIRGAAQISSGSPFSTPESMQEPNCQSAQDATRVTTNTQGMSSRDIMARTRARLAKLRQDSTLSNTTTGPKRGEHDALGPNASSKFPSTPHSPEDGNHTAPLTSNFMSSSTVARPHDPSAAGSSHPNFAQTRADVGDAAANAAILRAKLLKKLEDEKRAHDDDRTNNSSYPDVPAAPVAVEHTQVEAHPADNIGGSKQAQTEEELSFNHQDAEMLEKKLRGQAQLRIKLAAAKRQLAGAAVGSDGKK